MNRFLWTTGKVVLTLVVIVFYASLCVAIQSVFGEVVGFIANMLGFLSSPATFDMIWGNDWSKS